MATPQLRNERKLALLEEERAVEKDSKQAVWVFLWTLFVFKIATVAVIFYAARGSNEAQAMIFATTWFWFLIPAAAIAGPVMFWRRMIRQRRQREALKRSEWNVTPEPTIQIVIAGEDS